MGCHKKTIVKCRGSYEIGDVIGCIVDSCRGSWLWNIPMVKMLQTSDGGLLDVMSYYHMK